MRALQYQFSIPNFLAVRAADRLPLPVLQRGVIPGLSEIDAKQLPLPEQTWLRVKPHLAGICGSDLSMLLNRGSPALTPFISFPLVPGHEVVAEVLEIGSQVEGITPGQRVAVMPLINCEMRDLPPCPSCAKGEPGTCIHTAEGTLSAGMLAGFCKDLPGGWSQEMVIHRSQVFPVPETLDDKTAVLIEPLSVAIHAVLKDPPPADARVLIIGSGTIGLLTLAALRLLGHECDVTVLARHKVQVELAERFGATRVLRGTSAGDAAMQVTGARKYKPIKGGPSYAGGFDWVFDCVGSKKSVDDSLRVAGPNGRVVMVGCAAEISHIDLTFIWARELTISGCYVYGQEHSLEGQPHTFEVAMEALTSHPELELDRMVTHTLPLSRWRDAFRTVLDRGSSGSVKVVFDCQA